MENYHFALRIMLRLLRKVEGQFGLLATPLLDEFYRQICPHSPCSFPSLPLDILWMIQS